MMNSQASRGMVPTAANRLSLQRSPGPRRARACRGPAAALALLLAATIALGVSPGCSDEPAVPPPQNELSASAREAAIAAIEQNLLSQRLDEARSIADRLLRRAPRDASVNACVARVRIAQGQRADENNREPFMSEALVCLEVAIAGGLDDDENLALAASLAESLDDYRAAAPRWETLAARDPDAAGPAVRLGLNLWQRGLIAQASAQLDAAAARFPDDPTALAAWAEFRLERGDASALETLVAARALAPAEVGLRLREASWRRRLGAPNDAVTLLSALTPAEQARPEVTRELAAAWLALDRPERAAEAWEALIAANLVDPVTGRVDSDRSRAAMLEAAAAWIEAGAPARAAPWLDRCEPFADREELARIAELRGRVASGEDSPPPSP